MSETPAAEVWVEVYRGLRRQAQIVMRFFKDGGIESRDARHDPGVKAKPNEFVVVVPPAKKELALAAVARMKLRFPDIFTLGKAAKD